MGWNRSLWEKVIPKIRVDEATGCWIWVGSLDRAGYGKLGHEFDGLNTYIAKNGTRHCKACSAMHARNYNQKLRSA